MRVLAQRGSLRQQRRPPLRHEKLLERGIIVRDLAIPGHLRVSAGTEAETTAFLDAMSDIRLGA